jgi:1-acyl-sn-glycerol-3-phosphate acyltransferase
VFYRIDRIGSVPPTGAVLLLPNHPNSLLDPAVVWATAGRDVRFLAKSTLFESALRPVLAGAGAIPVYRRLDHGADLSRNKETFAAVAAALSEGDAVCIFPEGISHSSGRLEPLRTGAARMTLSAESGGTRVQLVPVGLNFDRKTTFRSRATIVFGKPFSGHDLAGGDNPANAVAVAALTERISDHIRLLLIEADPRADAAIVDRVDRLYTAARARSTTPEDRFARRQTIAAGIDRLRKADPERYDHLLLRLRRYDQRLRRFGLRDRHLDWQLSRTDVVSFAIREIVLGILLLPLCAAGLLLFFVPYRLTGIIAPSVVRQHDVLATAQVFTGLAVYGIWVIAFAAFAWNAAGPLAAALTVISMPALAVAGLFAIERETAVVDAVRAWWLLRRAHHDTQARLRRRRSELADVLDDVHTWLETQESTAETGA